VNIEQAIFTSDSTAKGEGYHLVACSPGVSDADRRELTIWGPSHDSLVETGCAALSINFHPLPSGCYCVSQTMPAGPEYSGRGAMVYTQSLVVPAEVLLRFGNNPFAVMRAAVAQGHVRVVPRVPERLDPIELSGECAAVDTELLGQLCESPGAAWFARLLESVLRHRMLGIVAGRQGPRLVAGLINCLPVPYRLLLTLTTGLKFSPRRPFHLICLGEDAAERRRLQRQYELAVFERPADEPPPPLPDRGWAAFVARALLSGKLEHFAACLANSQAVAPQHRPRQLSDLLTYTPDAPHRVAVPCPVDTLPEEPMFRLSRPDPLLEPTFEEVQIPMDAATGDDAPAGAGNPAAAALSRAAPAAPHVAAAGRPCHAVMASPARRLSRQHPEAAVRLMRLEATLFEAMSGDRTALEGVGRSWGELLAALPADTRATCRAEFLQFAIETWREFSSVEGRNPLRAESALDVLGLLLSEPADA
jgi:hypothetical protein